MRILVAVDESENFHRAVQYVGVTDQSLREAKDLAIWVVE